MFDPDPSTYRAADPGAEPTARPGPHSVAVPLGARPLRTARGWTLRLPIHAERVWVEKRAQTVEQVTVRLRRVEDLERRVARVRREALDVEASGGLEATRRVATARPGDEPPMP